MNTEQVAQKVVELTRKQAWKEALESLYAKDIVSVESRRMRVARLKLAGSRGCEARLIGGWMPWKRTV